MKLPTNIMTTIISTQINISDIFLMLLGLFISACIKQKLENKNGPMLWPIIGIVPSFLLNFHDLHNWITKTLQKSGKSYRIRGIFGGFEGVMTSNPRNIEYILKTNFKNFPKGKYYRERFRELLGGGIFNSDDGEWREQRRIATSEMHGSRFMHYSLKTVQDLVHHKLYKVIEEKIKSDQTVDLQELLFRFTFDNICMAVFGVDPGCLSLDVPEIPFAKAFEEATEYSLFRFLVPHYIWKSLRFFNLGKEKKLKEAVKIVHNFAETTVKNRKIEMFHNPTRVNSSHDDLLSRLIKLQHSQIRENLPTSKNFDDKFLRDFCVSFILAGRDTTSVALTWFFWLVHENPGIETKILTEIDEILGQRSYSYTREKISFNVEELDKMVYLQAALSESLRLYPSLPVDLKQAKIDDIFPDGTSIKAGHRVLYHIYAVGRDQSIWGDDCSEFKPERWIKDGEFVPENQVNYPVFNNGPRLCIGRKFSYTQMKTLVASILFRYKVTVLGGQDVVPKVTTTLYMKHGLLVTFELR